jgi:hypothetical protein
VTVTSEGRVVDAEQSGTATEPGRPGAGGPPSEIMVKAKIFAVGLLDMAIDLVVPTLVYLALAPTGRSAAVRLTAGGFVMAAKSVGGQVHGTADPDAAQAARAARPWRRGLLALVIAVVASAVTLGCSWGGLSDTWSIVVGTVVLAVAVLPMLLTSRRIDGFALLVLFEVAVSVVLVLVSDDPRFILVRPAFYTAIAGAYAIVTCFAGTPFMMEISRPMAAGGDPVRAAAFDRAWTTSAVFRRAERNMTLLLGVVLFAEAGLRVFAVYSQPETAVFHASVVSQIPAIVLLVGYVAAIRVLFVPAASREVDREVAAGSGEPAESTPNAVDAGHVDDITTVEGEHS